MRYIFSLFLLSVYSFLTAQNNQVEIRSVRTNDFPKLEFKLWVRNPEGLNSSTIQFFENQKAHEISLPKPVIAETSTKQKTVLFLVLNNGNATQQKWFSQLLESAVPQLESGDEWAFAAFSDRIDGKFVFPQKFEFQKGVNALNTSIDKLFSQKVSPVFGGQSQAHIALNEALELLGNQRTKGNKIIYIICNEQLTRPIFQGENPVQRSLRLNIPVYCVNYKTGKSGFHLRDLCPQTHGEFLETANNDLSEMQKIFTKSLKASSARLAGVEYTFPYQTTLPKEEQLVDFEIKTNFGDAKKQVKFPAASFVEKVKANPLKYGLILLVLLAFLVSAFVFWKKAVARKKEEERKRQKNLAELRNQQQANELKIEKQEVQLTKIKEEERAKELLAQQEIERKKQEEAEKIALDQMNRHGNLPFMEYSVESLVGTHKMTKSKQIVGRGEDCDWVVNHPTVSRKHFELRFQNPIFIIKDLDSSNGIMVNGQLQKECELKNGDLIQAGALIFTFHQ